MNALTLATVTLLIWEPTQIETVSMGSSAAILKTDLFDATQGGGK